MPNTQERKPNNESRIGRPKDRCGVFGSCGHPEVTRLIYFGLDALQPREGFVKVRHLNIPKPKS